VKCLLNVSIIVNKTPNVKIGVRVIVSNIRKNCSLTQFSEAFAQALKQWTAMIRRWLRSGKDVHVYFDNDAEGAAPRDAKRLLGLRDR